MDPTKEQPNAGAPLPTEPVQPTGQQGAPTPQPNGMPGAPVTGSGMPTGDPMAPAGGPGMNPMQNKKSLIMLIVVVVVAVAVAAAAYFLFMKKDNRDSANNAAKNSTADVDATALDTLNSLTMNAPTDTKGYTDSGISSTTAKQYVAEDESCVLQFGTLTAEQLPGTDLGDIVARQVEAVKEAGGNLTGPDSGDALLLKDASDDSVTYSMPTLIFSYSKDDNRVKQYYSAVVLKNGDRAFVSRICGNAEAKDVPDSDLKKVNDLARNITINKQ